MKKNKREEGREGPWGCARGMYTVDTCREMSFCNPELCRMNIYQREEDAEKENDHSFLLGETDTAVYTGDPSQHHLNEMRNGTKSNRPQ